MAAPVVAALLAVGVLGACGDDAVVQGKAGPTVVVTTSVLGDVVTKVVRASADVVVVMPPGASPHEFQPSPKQVAAIRSADAIVLNGGGLEEGLIDVVEDAEAAGTPTFEAAAASGVTADEHGEEEDGHALDATGEDDRGDDHDSEHDAHFFTSPAAMQTVVEALIDFLAEEVEGIDERRLRESGASYLDELDALDEEVEDTLAAVPEQHRVLITNHDVLSAFAARYGFEVRGTIIPGASTTGAADASTLARLAEVIRAAQVPAIFVDVSSSDRVAHAIATEAGDVEVVQLYTEALGDEGSEAATYVAMVRTNAGRIADALG